MTSQPSVPFEARLAAAHGRRRFLEQSAGTAAAAFFASTLTAVDRVWAQQPAPIDPKLVVHTRDPLNAEPPLADLESPWLTQHVYIRSHGTPPKIVVPQYRLFVEGMVERAVSFGLDDLRALPDHAITATLTCAGNRRSEMKGEKPIPGVPWGAGAVANVRWHGVRLSNLLHRAGIKEGAKHVWFESLDSCKLPDGKLVPFGGSIPLDKAIESRDVQSPVLLAFAMNEKELTLNHGFPVRVVVPGYIGARSVKWLGKIVVSDRPSPNYYMADAYKVVKTGDHEEVEKANPILEYPVNAAICQPAPGIAVAGSTIKAKGYALPPGKSGVTIDRVELSSDGGRTWMKAKLTSPQREYCWTHWEADVPTSATAASLIVRAVDSRGEAQPETTEWNAKGYLYNAWHRVALKPKA